MLSVCITNFNREQLLHECIEPFLYDERVTEIVISDDASEYGLYSRVVDFYKYHSKVKIYRNEKNLDCYLNKHKAVSLATNEWVLLIDSDNVFSKEFIDILFKEKEECYGGDKWDEDVIYQPSFAKPHFDFTAFEGRYIDAENVASFMMQHQFQTMLNASNNFFNRNEWLKVFDSSVDPVTSDSIFHNFNWLYNTDKFIYVVPGLHYNHRVSNHGKEEGSHYVKRNKKTPKGFHESIVNKLKAMR